MFEEEEEEYLDDSKDFQSSKSSKPEKFDNDSDNFNMDDEEEDDDDDIIEIQLNSNLIEVDYTHMIKFSQEIRNKYNSKDAQKKLPKLLIQYEKDYEIQEKNIVIFFKFFQGKDIEVDASNYCDLVKLAQLFKVIKLNKTLNRFYQSHSKSISLISKLIKEHKIMQNFGISCDSKMLSDMEKRLSNQISDCLKDEFFSDLPISIIVKTIEKSNRENVTSDDLYDFIIKSVSDRHILFQYIDIEKLSDDRLHDIFDHYQDESQQPESEKKYYTVIGKSAKYYITSVEEKKYEDDKINSLIKENEDMSNKIDEQKSLSFEYQEYQQRMLIENEKIQNNIKEKKERKIELESQLNEKRLFKLSSQLFLHLMKVIIQSDNGLDKLKVSGKSILHLTCELGNLELFQYVIGLDKIKIESISILNSIFFY